MCGWVSGILCAVIGSGLMAAGATGADAATVYQVTGSGLAGNPRDGLLSYNVNVSWSLPDFISGDTIIPQATLQCNNTGGFICTSPVTVASKSGQEELSFTIFNPTFADVTIDSLFPLSAFMHDGVTVGSSIGGPPATLTVTGKPDVAPAPLPSTWSLMLLGFAGLGVAGYKRTQRKTAGAAI